ncbi:SPOR domain-containing protein [Flavobacteriaceae bacterium TP-CH-4]|uniref:SPOR domain-containing protein n=1 Tax=Pelagihabitans pacificus TaxID=2696054 RepID=A0A967ASG3_9FLAO|nr:SPOR domain-containing protein [Pelagihabitans pacificus]NHF59137.1 SPOR domain-containing protein [Pelagihabitans pacificus]
MGVEHYLYELLYRYNCVVIPGFGAFLTQRQSAVLHKASHTLYPPTKTLSFNSQLTSNDGLLVSYMAEAEKTDYESMLQQVTEAIAIWKKQLRSGDRLVFPNIGELWLNEDGKTQFQPSEQVNFLTSSFGLAPFKSPPVTREVLRKEVMAMEEQIPFMVTPEKRRETSFRPYLKYAAIFLLALSTGFTAYRAYQQGLDNQQLAREAAQEHVTKQIQEATFFDAVPMELPTLTLETTKKERAFDSSRKIHHVIAGAFRFRKNANKKIRLLKRGGFNPSYLGTNESGLHIVTYDSYTDADEALAALRKIKITQSPDAWLKSVK